MECTDLYMTRRNQTAICRIATMKCKHIYVYTEVDRGTTVDCSNLSHSHLFEQLYMYSIHVIAVEGGRTSHFQRCLKLTSLSIACKHDLGDA